VRAGRKHTREAKKADARPVAGVAAVQNAVAGRHPVPVFVFVMSAQREVSAKGSGGPAVERAAQRPLVNNHGAAVHTAPSQLREECHPFVLHIAQNRQGANALAVQTKILSASLSGVGVPPMILPR